MQTINDSLVDDESVVQEERVENAPKRCSIPVPGSFKKQTVFFYDGETSYTTVAAQVVFVIALFALMIFGLE